MPRDEYFALYCSAWKWSEEDAQNKFEYHIGLFYPKLLRKYGDYTDFSCQYT